MRSLVLVLMLYSLFFKVFQFPPLMRPVSFASCEPIQLIAASVDRLLKRAFCRSFVGRVLERRKAAMAKKASTEDYAAPLNVPL